MYNEGPKTFIAGEDLSDRRLVKIKSGTVMDPPEVVYADAGEDAIGVTEASAVDGDPIAVRMFNDGGTFEIECLVDSAIDRGTKLYGADDGMVSDTVAGNEFGWAVEVGADNAHIEVIVAPMFKPKAIADPGASGAIPVINSGNCALTTAAAETRTIAIPTFPGQQLAVSLDVDGGDATITVAAAINQIGNNTIVLGDVGDTIVLTAVQVAAALVWRVLVNDGCTLSTV